MQKCRSIRATPLLAAAQSRPDCGRGACVGVVLQQRGDRCSQLLDGGVLVDHETSSALRQDLPDHRLVEIRVLRYEEQWEVVCEREHRCGVAAVPDHERDGWHHLGVCGQPSHLDVRWHPQLVGADALVDRCDHVDWEVCERIEDPLDSVLLAVEPHCAEAQ
jgi:hypothetical protein